LYPHRGGSLAAWQVGGAGLLLAGVTALAVVWRRRRPALFVGWLWYLGTLVPVIGLIQVGIQGMADRYTYFPLIGIFLALAWSLPIEMTARPWGWGALVAGMGVVLAGCLVTTGHQLRYWHDEATLWRHAVEVTQDNAVAHVNWGVQLYAQDQVEEADEQFTRAIALAPRSRDALHDLGLTRLLLGQIDDAVDAFRRAIEVDAWNPLHYNQLGLALASQGQPFEAADAFRQALRLDPNEAEFYCNLGLVLDDVGDHAGARTAYAEARRRDESWPRQAQRIAQDLLRSANPKRRGAPEVLFRARQACQAADKMQPDMLDTLAAAYAVRGHTAQATVFARRVLDAAVTAGQADLAKQIRGWLRQHQQEITGRASSLASPDTSSIRP
jgi:Flp pilus assembly protein TadD